MSFIIGLLCFLFAGVFYYYVLYSPQNDSDWRGLPTLKEYLEEHPECKTDDKENAKCYSCGSDKVIFQPLTIHTDPRYKHICFSCKRVLFKSKSLM